MAMEDCCSKGFQGQATASGNNARGAASKAGWAEACLIWAIEQAEHERLKLRLSSLCRAGKAGSLGIIPSEAESLACRPFPDRL